MIPALATDQVRRLERFSHSAVAKVQVMPADEPGTWIDLPVTGVNVTMNEPGVQPLRSVTVDTLQSAAKAAGVSVLGGWMRVYQDLTFWQPTAVKKVCPWGYYRIESTRLARSGEMQITGYDAGQVLVTAPALTLAEKSIPKGTSILTRLYNLLAGAWPSGMYRWATLLDSTGVIDINMSKVGTVMDFDRVEVITNLARLLNSVLVPVNDGSAIYRLIKRPSAATQSGVTINPGGGGNLVDDEVTFDRSSLINQVHAVWSQEKPPSAGGGIGIQQQARVIVSYDEPDSAARTTGPFGIQSAEVSSSDVDTQAEAVAVAKAAMRGTLVWNHDYPTRISPIYGIESGDVVYVSKVGGFHVVGGSVDLMGEWSLTLRRADGTLVRHAQHWNTTPTRWEGTITDDAQWVDIKVPNSIDMSLDSANGWHVNGGTMTAKDGTLYLKSNGSSMTLRSSDVIPVPTLRRVSVEFSMGRSRVGDNRRGYNASASIRYAGKVYSDGQFPLDDDPIDGPDRSKNGADIRCKADQQLPPNADTTFAVGIKFYNLVANQIIRVESVTIERALRPKAV